MIIHGYPCEQACIVVAKDWDTHKAMLYRFEEKEGKWKLLNAHPVVIGQKGMGWSEGLHSTESSLPQKSEGDRKTPAGIFTFKAAFGSAREAPPHLPYIQTSPDLIAVDDSQSIYYNQIISLSKVPHKDWTSAEEMTHELYKWGLVVNHNMNPAKPYKGSCIFFHLWRRENSGTYGCTAMPEAELLDLMLWLDPKKHPLLIQLPQQEYSARAASWGLPSFPLKEQETE